MSRSRTFRALILGIVPAALVATVAFKSLGLGSETDPVDDGPAVPTHYSNTIKPYEQQELQQAIDETMSGLSSQDFASLEFTSPPKGRDDQSGLWMHATMMGNETDRTKLAWEADLAQGAIADRVAGPNTNLAEVVTGSDEQLMLPDGSTEAIGGGAGDITPGQVFDAQATDESDDAIRSSVTDDLKPFGLDVKEVSILRPLGPAVAVIATASQVDELGGKFPELWSALVGSPYKYEGVFLEIDSPDGTPLVKQGAAFRAGSGNLWFAPGMDDKLQIAHGYHPPSD